MNVFTTFEHSLIINFDSVLKFIIISKIHRKYFSDTDLCSVFNEGQALHFIAFKIKFTVNACICKHVIF